MDIKSEIIIPWTELKREKVLLMIEDWIQEFEVTDGETIQQSDEPAIDAVNIMSDIIDVIFSE